MLNTILIVMTVIMFIFWLSDRGNNNNNFKMD